MSRTGIEPCSAEVMAQLMIVCAAVCQCNGNGGQQCVDNLLLLHNIANPKSQILQEHPYYLPKKGAPNPILKSGGWDNFIPSFGRMIGATRLQKKGVPQEIINAYLQRKINMNGVRTIDGYSSIEKYTKGELSIPDTVIVKDRTQPAIGDNVLGVGEVKFPKDDWDDDQYRAARRIARGGKKVHTLTPKSCSCGEKKQKPEPQLAPVPVPAPSREPARQSSTQPIPQGALEKFGWTVAGLALLYFTRGALNNATVNGGVLTVPTDYPNDGGMI